MSLKAVASSLVALTLVLVAGTQAQITPEKFRAMVVSELEKQGRSNDSLTAPLTVTGIGAEGADFLLIPVYRDGKLISLFRDDPRRDWVKEINSAVTLKLLKPELLSQTGLERFLSAKKLKPKVSYLVSLGPLSLFGSVGAGWYLPTDGSFYLLSLEGRLASEAEVVTFWPEKAELIRQLARKTDTGAKPEPEELPEPAPEGDFEKKD